MAKKILIIEDEKDLAQMMSKRLRWAGYTVKIVPDVTFGISESHVFKPDLIILDLLIPGGGGLSVLSGLKLSIHTENIPVIVLTGVDDDDMKKKVFAEGVKAYIKKPYDPEFLLYEIDRLLKQ